MKYLILFIFLSSFCWADDGQTVKFIPAQKDCFSGDGKAPWKACVYKPANGKTNGNIAYMLHGRGQSEQVWNDNKIYTSQIQQYWQQNKITPPIVVTVSFGETWLLVPKGTKDLSGLYEFFVNTLIPLIEKKTGPIKERLVFGDSMGGINSLVLAFKSSLFSRAAALCPVIAEVGPYSESTKLEKFIKRTGAVPQLIGSILEVGRSYLADEKEWNNFSPPVIFEKAKLSKKFQIYISCGLYDTYGNYEASEKLAFRAKEKSISTEWRPQYGGHCSTDIPSLAEFLTKASLL